MKTGVLVGVCLGLMGCNERVGATGIGVMCVEESPTQLVNVVVVDVCADLGPQQNVNGGRAGGGRTEEVDGVPHRFQDVEVTVWTSRRSSGCSQDEQRFSWPLNDQFGFHHWTYGPEQQLSFFIDEAGQLRDPEGVRRQRMCADPAFDRDHSGLEDTAVVDTAEPPMDTGVMDTGVEQQR